MPDIIPAWAQTIISAHLFSDAVVVSHATRMKSYRYFVWQEDDQNDFKADNIHAERAVSGWTDLFTRIEFDPWVDDLGTSFDAHGIAWEKTGTTYEPDTGFFHHTWEWTVVG